MAACEKCGKTGFAPIDMYIEANLFVGPCCADETMSKVDSISTKSPKRAADIHVLSEHQEDGELEYGFEVSNKAGIRAYAKYGGASLAFERSPREIRDWAEKSGLLEQKKVG
jgi:hypothetical protein